ncbi:MAG: hypothetical protein LBP22_14120 [Deltaproteobacteria bacterium]|nr:hypothetical protein [Deltaproteobacteria bacterium]
MARSIWVALLIWRRADSEAGPVEIFSTPLKMGFLSQRPNPGAKINAANEVRLIYVTDRETFDPIYYRAIPGNIVDVAALKGTVCELKSLNVNVGYSAPDAGYNSESSLEELFSSGITL